MEPIFGDIKLEDLKQRWLNTSALNQNSHFQGVSPIESIALAGAIVSETGEINLRDAVMCDAVISNLVRNVPLAPNVNIDIYNLFRHRNERKKLEDKDIFKTEKAYDTLVICNIRSLRDSGTRGVTVVDQYHEAQREYEESVKKYGRGHMIRFSGNALDYDVFGGGNPDSYYAAMSTQAAKSIDSYVKLAHRVRARFVCCWGFKSFVDISMFQSPATYNSSHEINQKYTNETGYAVTYKTSFREGIVKPFRAALPADIRKDVIPSRWIESAHGVFGSVFLQMGHRPQIGFAICNQMFEQLCADKKNNRNAIFNPLFRKVATVAILTFLRKLSGGLLHSQQNNAAIKAPKAEPPQN